LLNAALPCPIVVQRGLFCTGEKATLFDKMARIAPAIAGSLFEACALD